MLKMAGHGNVEIEDSARKCEDVVSNDYLKVYNGFGKAWNV